MPETVASAHGAGLPTRNLHHPGLFPRPHQADAVSAGATREVHSLRDVLEVNFRITLYEYRPLSARLKDSAETRPQIAPGNILLVDLQGWAPAFAGIKELHHDGCIRVQFMCVLRPGL